MVIMVLVLAAVCGFDGCVYDNKQSNKEAAAVCAVVVQQQRFFCASVNAGADGQCRYARLLDENDDKARLDVWRESFQIISSSCFGGNDYDYLANATVPNELDY